MYPVKSLKALVVLWASCLSTRLHGQPAACIDDSQCSVGHYCEETACQKCLNCEDYKRESPLQQGFCVKSVVKCGGCFKGLVEDLRMDRACVLPLDPEPGEVLPTYVWAIIGLVVLVFIFFVIGYIVFKKDTLFQYILKIRATTSVHGTCDASPSAPELAPPPYDALYAPAARAAAEAPAPNGAGAHIHAHVIDEEEVSHPFIKRVPSARARGARESADSQAARPFNNPAYIRGPQSSYIQNEELEPVSPPFTPHNEDTMESLWTPNENSNNIIINTNGNSVADASEAAGAAAVAARAHSPEDEGPPAKALCIREDSNNNRGRESEGAGQGAPSGASAPTVVISVVNNFTSFEQRNNLNLPRH